MGLGILFVGYFLLLNFAYSYFTDAISAAVMLYALYRLSSVNKAFKRASFASGVFLIVGLFELILSVVNTVSPIYNIDLIYTFSAIVRHGVIFVLTLLILLAVKELSAEVDLPELVKRATRNIWFSLFVYAFNILLEAGGPLDFIDPKLLVALYFASLVLTLAVNVLNLLLIYGTHMRVYIPDLEKGEKKSRFGFVRAFEAHEEERQREYAEYRMEKQKNKKRKKK